MAQVELIALLSFDHNGPIKRGQRFFVTDKVAEKFLRRGLARAAGAEQQSFDSNLSLHPGEELQEVNSNLPLDPAGEASTSSVSPADPASPETTANESDDGASPRKQKKSGASSS